MYWDFLITPKIEKIDADMWKHIKTDTFPSCDLEECVYFDMDGVLADWNERATADRVYSGGYFLNLNPNFNVIKLINRLSRKGVNIGILSKANVSNVQNAVFEKHLWLNEYVKGIVDKNNILFIPLEQNKSDFLPLMANRKIIIDDYNPNLYDIQKNMDNCICIKAYNGINSPNPDFDYIDITNEAHIDKNVDVILSALRELEAQKEEVEL